MGINTVFMSKELAGNETFRQMLVENNMKTFLIFPVFYDPGALKKDSSLYAITDKGETARDEWVEFVCPSRTEFRKNKVNEAVALIRNLRPDGLSIDFIRQFVYWEKIYPDRKSETIDRACFCDSCTAGFCRKAHARLPEDLLSISEKAGYILNNLEDEWTDYQCKNISSMAEEISEAVRGIDPGIRLNIHIVPWRDGDFGGAGMKVASQDLPDLSAFSDYVSPMCYSQMLKRDAGWIKSVISEMNRKAPRKVLPSIQVYSDYIDYPFTAEDFGKCLDAALKPPSLGVIFFSWPLFEKDPARIDIAVKKCGKNQDRPLSF
jgi:hypothetical protein